MSITNYDTLGALTVISYMKSKGLNNNGIAGLLGNLYSESRLYSNNLQNSCEKKIGMTDAQYTEAVNNGTYADFDNDRFGYGIAQWTSAGRKAGLHEYVKKNNKSIDDLQSQVEYLYIELSSKYKTVLAELCSANNTVASCAEIVVCKFEIPKSVIDGGESKANTINIRTGYAQEFYDKYLADDTSATATTEEDSFAISRIYLTDNDCYKEHRDMTPQGIVVHSTGCNNPYIKRYVQPDDGAIGANKNKNDWNRSGVDKCVHAFVGLDAAGNVTGRQALPWDMCCWGCGRGARGSYNYPATKAHPLDVPYIQFEICEDDLTDERYFNAVMSYAVKLCAYLCKQFNISITNVVSHHEAAELGMASNHSDIDHWLSRFNKDMNWFRTQVTNTMKASTSTATSREVTSRHVTSCDLTSCDGYECYVTQEGDTWAKIFIKTKSSKEAIKKFNEYNELPKLKPGMVVRIRKSDDVYEGLEIDKAKSLDKTLAKIYTAKNKLNVRCGAGITRKKVDVLESGSKVQCFGYYTEIIGTKWLLVQYTKDGEIKTGFVSSIYLS